jgi:hypothetical protein
MTKIWIMVTISQIRLMVSISQIRLLESNYSWPKVILLSGAHCSCIQASHKVELFLQKILLLSQAYRHVEDIDLFMGGVMEDKCPGILSSLLF